MVMQPSGHRQSVRLLLRKRCLQEGLMQMSRRLASILYSDLSKHPGESISILIHMTGLISFQMGVIGPVISNWSIAGTSIPAVFLGWHSLECFAVPVEASLVLF